MWFLVDDGLGCVWLSFLGAFAFAKSQKSTKGLDFVPGAFRKVVFP
jgi:hypothetical protein